MNDDERTRQCKDKELILFCMRSIIQFKVWRGDTQFIAECMDLPIVTQAPTLDALSKNIQEALELHLEDENAMEQFTSSPSVLISFELPVRVHA